MERDDDQRLSGGSKIGQSRPSRSADTGDSSRASNFIVSASTLTMPKGGGAIRGIGEKFGANPVTGTATMSVPIFSSPGRSGFGPQLSLSYDSGSGNGPFGYGWSLSAPHITRRTDRGLPQYRDADESDTFILSGASTFDIRTFRLCRRVLMFHHYPEESGGDADTLVRSTDLTYQEDSNSTQVVAIAQIGYARQPDKSYVARAMPKLEFKYSDVSEANCSVTQYARAVQSCTYRW